jgi:hypothetical protein
MNPHTKEELKGHTQREISGAAQEKLSVGEFQPIL